MTIRRRERKYFAPQNTDNRCKCDFPGCEKEGAYRAPKNKGLKEYFWFCLEHVQSYNSEWNYYADESDDADEKEEEKKSKMHFKGFRSKVHYQYGYKLKDDFEFFGQYAKNFSSRNEGGFNEKERQFLIVMEIDEDKVSLDLLKKQYKKLVKKCHPDLHRHDTQAEEKFKRLSEAYQALLAKMS